MSFKNKLIGCIPLLSIALLILLQIHNFNIFPITRGFDARDHIAYIKYLQIYHRIPLANEGWELYQAPLYYLLSSLIPNIHWVKIIGFLGYLSLLFFGHLLFRNRVLSLVSSVLIGSLPLVIYLAVPISNEFFAGVVISATIVWYVLKKKENNFHFYTILGILLGFSILAKATAWILIIAIVIDMLYDNNRNKMSIVRTLLISFIIGGWFYLRNIILFRNPFISSIDFHQFKLWQPPGYRDLRFFTDLSGLLKFDLFQAHHYSLWAGTYFSWFYDGHNVVIPVQGYSKIGVVLILFSLPIFLSFIYGYIQELKRFSQSKFRVFLLYPILLFISYIFYNVKLPFYSTVKSTFLISAIIPFVYFTIKAIQPLNKYYSYITVYIFIYSLLIIKAFWILPQWYN